MFHRRKSGTGSDPPGLLFLPARGKGLTRFSDALLFLSVSRGREKNKKQKKPESGRADMKKASRRMLSISSGSRYIFNPRFRSCRMSEKENFPVSLSNFTDLSFCTPSGVSIRFTSSGFPL